MPPIAIILSVQPAVLSFRPSERCRYAAKSKSYREEHKDGVHRYRFSVYEWAHRRTYARVPTESFACKTGRRLSRIDHLTFPSFGLEGSSVPDRPGPHGGHSDLNMWSILYSFFLGDEDSLKRTRYA